MKKNDHLAQKPDDVAEATDAASLVQGVIEDHADIQSAQAESQEQSSSKVKSLLRIGPGLITGVVFRLSRKWTFRPLELRVADDDPSVIPHVWSA